MSLLMLLKFPRFHGKSQCGIVAESHVGAITPATGLGHHRELQLVGLGERDLLLPRLILSLKRADEDEEGVHVRMREGRM